MACKRLRGWQLEMESGRPSKATTLEKDTLEKESALGNKLLSLWAHGTLSAVMVRELAHLAIQDGAKGEDLHCMAKAGDWGGRPGNCHRDIMARFCHHVTLPQPVNIQVGCIDPKTSQPALEKAAVFLPHQVWASLGHNYPFHLEKMGKCSLETFWSRVESSNDDKLLNHPMTLEKDWKEKNVPLFLHGDGVELKNRDTLMCFSFGSLLSNMSSLESHWLCATFPKSATSDGTWPPIWKYLRWSFDALGKGYHPLEDPDGKPLEKGSPFFECKGQPLHPQGLKGTLWSIIGDQEFFSNALGLPHWNAHYPCHECDGQNWEGCALEKAVKEIRLEQQNFQEYSHAEHMAEPASDHPLFQLDHISCKNVKGDHLHILFCKGLYGHLIGSILHYCCWREGPGKVCKKKPWERLSVLFEQIQLEYKSQESTTRLTNLRLSMFTDSQKPWSKWANLDVKGGEAKHLLPALIPVIKRLFANSRLPEEMNMILAAESLEKLVSLWDSMEIIPTDAEFANSMALGKAFLDSYHELNVWSLEKDRKSFHKVHKHHTFLHLLKNSRHMNPKLQWCFKAEDFVGHCAKLGRSVSMGVSSCRLSLKISNKYRVLQHLLLTRKNFVASCNNMFGLE